VCKALIVHDDVVDVRIFLSPVVHLHSTDRAPLHNFVGFFGRATEVFGDQQMGDVGDQDVGRVEAEAQRLDDVAGGGDRIEKPVQHAGNDSRAPLPVAVEIIISRTE